MNKPMRMCKAPGCMKLTADGYCPDHKPKKERKTSAAWHHLYTNPRYGWKRRRDAQLAREPFCCECAKHGLRVLATDADHVLPHYGNLELFLHGKLQSLCHSCHSRKTMAEMQEFFATQRGKNR